MYISTCPYRHKYELVNWASAYFKEGTSRFNKMSKKQLYAIFFSIMFEYIIITIITLAVIGAVSSIEPDDHYYNPLDTWNDKWDNNYNGQDNHIREDYND